MDHKGLFVLKRGKNEILNQIQQVCKGQGFDSVISEKQRVSLFKTCCRRTIDVIDDCFASEMYGPSRCKQIVKNLMLCDDIEQVENGRVVVLNLLSDLYCIAQNAVKISDLPSCKRLTEMSSKDLAAAASDLVKSDIVKGVAKTILIGLGIADSIGISDVRNYYCNLKTELQRELAENNRQIRPAEQFLMEKFDAEIGYCDLASQKAGLGMLKESADLVDIARKNIVKFESRKSDSVQFNMNY